VKQYPKAMIYITIVLNLKCKNWIKSQYFHDFQNKILYNVQPGIKKFTSQFLFYVHAGFTH